jgi:lysozyme family protein
MRVLEGGQDIASKPETRISAAACGRLFLLPQGNESRKSGVFMQSSYDEALRHLLRHEGGYTDHPDDPGGPTNFGITIYDYRKYVKPEATAADVKAMSLDDAVALYKSKYWNALACDALPPGVDYALFDYGVNSGVGRAARVLQRLVDVAADGVIGPMTIAAARRCAPAVLIELLCDERLQFLKSLKTWPVFGKGWRRRVAEVKQTALAMAAQRGN